MRSRSENLKIVKNIQENPNVALLIDKYNEDWTILYFIMIQGKASVIGGHRLEKNELLLLLEKLTNYCLINTLNTKKSV